MDSGSLFNVYPVVKKLNLFLKNKPISNGSS